MNKYEIENIEKHRQELITENIKLKAVIEKLLIDKKALQEQFSLNGVGCILPIKKEIIFDDSLKAEIETTDKNLKVLRAVNGWGYAIDVTKIHINEK